MAPADPAPAASAADADEDRYRRAERRLWDSLRVVPTEHRVRLDSLGCEVRIQQVGDSEPVLFLHGASPPRDLVQVRPWAPTSADVAR